MIRRLLVANFHGVYRLDRWLRRRFTPAGATLLVVALSAAVFGINMRATLAYQLFAVATAALLFALAATARFRPAVRLRRRLPRHATSGVPLLYTLEAQNGGTHAERGLYAADWPRAERPRAGEFARFREVADRRRNWFDRRVGYPRWVQFMRRREGMRERITALPELQPGRVERVRMSLLPQRRGVLQLAAPMLVRTDPFGMCRVARACGEPDRLLVLPQRHAMAALTLPGRSRQPPGASASADQRTGGSDDFAMLREYRPGDPVRHLHWRTWARLGTPVVMEFHDRHRPRQAVVLDNACEEVADEVFEAAVSAAASLLGALQSGPSARHADTLLMCAEEGGVDGRDLPALLAGVQAAPAHALDLLAERLLREASRLSGCALVLAAWDEPRRELVGRLRRRGVELLVLLVVADDAGTPSPGPMADRPREFHVLRPATLAPDLARVGRAARPARAA